ncbi:hemolysin family protein [Ruminococcus sp. CLA-AA-H200]|uniref:Hemolysin family protein n=1 Tax=Ruminococcus turbiniformis TaxID=2881258 RepID=A0ABS8G0H7_9FIRM|nr:hemolysin family protein [Ruminococcus turbiniformis]MCC2255058.1 hemolysin family protein [Ruminococcus turbiniformis]
MDADPAGNTILFDLLLLLFFTLMNAFFAGAEMAVVSVNKNRIRSLAEEGNKKAKVIEGLFEDSTKFLSTIQVAITFAGFYSSASAAASISPALAEWMRGVGVPYSSQIAHNGVTLLLMFFNLVFGELVPKRIALQKAEAFCMLTVMPIHYVSIVLSPFIKLLSVSTKMVLKLLHMKTEDQEEAVTEEEIKALLKMGNESGAFDDDEREMIDSVFAFDDRTAREIMVPRRDVVTIDIEEPFEEIIDEILETRHNRIPVYEESIDNIIGVLHVKDVMIELRKNSPEKLNIREMLHEPYFVPETKEADELFRTMQATRHHMAILVDEYGGFSGIVTIEDLVEEIMGDINEEYEEVVPEIEPVSEDEYRLDGGLLIDDLNEELGLKLETENYDTLSGYLIEKLGHIPGKDDRDVIETDNLVFKVEEVKDNRITKVMLRILPPPETEDDEEEKGGKKKQRRTSDEEETE